MLRRFYSVITIVMLLVWGHAATAQQPVVNGLIATVSGDLWAYDPMTGTREQLTEWGYNGQPHLSPDGVHVAYLSQSEESVNNPGAFYPGTPPTNIWLLNRTDGTFRRIADQSGGGDILRSEPAWSPDGSRIAWSELTLTGQDIDWQGARLMIYDMRSGQTSMLANNYDMGMQDGGIYMPPVTWGGGGIMRILYTAIDTGGDGLPFAQILELYNPDTGAMSAFTLGRSAPMGDPDGDIVLEHMWADDNGQPRIVLFWRIAGWQTLDPNTGVLAPLAVVPFRTVQSGVGMGGIRLTPLYQPQANSAYYWHWQAEVMYDGGTPGYTTSIGYNAPTLRDNALPVSSGIYDIAWVTYDGSTQNVHLWQDGAARNPQVIFSAGITGGGGVGLAGVAWQPMQWVIDRSAPPAVTPPPVTPPPGQCPSPHPSGFEVGELVQVSPGPPNNWREQPSTSARVLGVFPAGTSLTILDGPVCADGYNWYYVQFTEGRGWTAEGDGAEYWLQPAG